MTGTPRLSSTGVCGLDCTDCDKLVCDLVDEAGCMTMSFTDKLLDRAASTAVLMSVTFFWVSDVGFSILVFFDILMRSRSFYT